MSSMTSSVTMYLMERGSGSPILFLHGVPDSAEMWNGIIQQLENRYHCFAPDLPGLGRSTAPADFNYSLNAMAHFLDSFITERNIPTPLNLVVTDFGATYGLAWAVTQPEKVRRIAIVGSANFSTKYRWHSTAQIFRTPLLGELAMAMTTPSIFEQTMHQNAPLLSKEHIRQTYALSIAKPTVKRTILRMYRSVNAQSFVGWEERLTALTATIPTLVLWGDKDPFIAPHCAERFGNAQVEHFPDNGHWLAIEASEVVAQKLARFFT